MKGDFFSRYALAVFIEPAMRMMPTIVLKHGGLSAFPEGLFWVESWTWTGRGLDWCLGVLGLDDSCLLSLGLFHLLLIVMDEGTSFYLESMNLWSSIVSNLHVFRLLYLSQGPLELPSPIFAFFGQ